MSETQKQSIININEILYKLSENEILISIIDADNRGEIYKKYKREHV